MKYHIEVIRSARYCYINAISDDTRIRVGNVSIDLNSEDSSRYQNYNNKVAKIILVQTNQSVCHQGIATALLNKTIEEFKDYVLYLSVIPLRSDNTKDDLIKFYSKFGFKRYNNDICITTMIRK